MTHQHTDSAPRGATVHRRSALAGATGLALLLTACGADSSGPAAHPPSSTPATRTVSTEQGDVTVPGDPQRIVVLTGGLAGYLFALDAPVVATDTRVLGVTDLDGGFPPSWADDAREEGTTALPAGEELDLEAVAAARPDLIVGGGQGISAVQAVEQHDLLSDIAPTVLVPTGVTAWQDQLDVVAEAAGRSSGVADLVRGYEEEVAEVAAAVTPPEGASAFLLSLPNGKPYLVPGDAALPQLTEEVGFTADDVVTKAGDPPLYGSGDSFEVSPELLATVADAPNLFVVDLGGRSAAELATDPLYAALPAFRRGSVHELPPTSYRPDLDGALGALDALGQEFSRG